MEHNFIISKSLKARIMRRIYLIWFLRQISSPFLIKTFFLGLALTEAAFFYSLSNIFKNISLASSNFPTLSSFMFSSFQKTDALSKLFFIGLMLLLGLFLHQIYISISSRKHQQILQQV